MAGINPLIPNEEHIKALRIVYFVLSISGLMFTSALLYIFIKKAKKGFHSDTILSLIVVSVDAIASGGLLFKAIFTQYPYNILENFGWCAYDLIINTHSLALSGYVLSILSLQRMLLIVFNIKVSIWIWLSLVFILNFLCWGRIIQQIVIDNLMVSSTKVFCTSKPNLAALVSNLIVIGSMILTYVTTVISYVFIIVFSCRQCLKQLSLNLDRSKVYRELRTIIFKSLFFLIPYMLVYSGMTFCFFYEVATGKHATWLMYYVAILLISTSVVVNCLTVLYMNKEVNKEFLNLIFSFESILHR